MVDVQNDFADPAGSLAGPGRGRRDRRRQRGGRRGGAAGATVVYTQDWHPPRTPHFVTDGGPWPVHCVRDTWGAAFHPDLVVAGESVRKGTGGEDGYSGFTMRDSRPATTASTGLDELLRARGVERVTVVGLALDYCVRATALDAVALGYRCVVPRRATAPVEVHAGDGAAAAGRARRRRRRRRLTGGPPMPTLLVVTWDGGGNVDPTSASSSASSTSASTIDGDRAAVARRRASPRIGVPLTPRDPAGEWDQARDGRRCPRRHRAHASRPRRSSTT